MQKRFPIKDQFQNIEELNNWFKGMTSKDLPTDPKGISYSKPFQGRKDRLEELANRLTWYRDQFISKVIQESLLKYKKVLVVYGSSHLPPQKCYLEKNLGIELKIQ